MKFPPGSEWLYLRIYGGPQSVEEWLTGDFHAMLALWKQTAWVDLFHFIHYIDPDYHLRVRLHLVDPFKCGPILVAFRETCGMQLKEDLFWKIEVGTYEPEYERFGTERMAVIEKWFDMDSSYWLNEFKRLRDEADPQVWKSALRSVDSLLNDFGLRLTEKSVLLKRIRKSTSSLLELQHDMKIRLDEKYRKLSTELRIILDPAAAGADWLLAERSERAKSAVEYLKDSFGGMDGMLASGLLPDLVHFTLNRAFRARHQIQEFVVYYFLGRFYDSLVSREIIASG